MENKNFKNYMISAGAQEIVTRYGNAGAEFLKGLRGIDYETGIKFDRSLLTVSNYKINPDYVENNIKQQAGYSAEIAAVSKRNAESIISSDHSIHLRSEDYLAYGKNHNIVDLIEITEDGSLVTAQMKFVSRPDELLDKIAKGSGGGKNDLSRYLKAHYLDLPTEQVEVAKQHCEKQIHKLQKQILVLEKQGKTDIVEKYKEQIDNYKKLKEKIRDSHITSEEAKRYRLDPKWETTKDILSVSHRAGIEGAKLGAAIGGGISLISNIIATKSGNKAFSDALLDSAKDTLTSAGVGYATAFTGSVVKGLMQQSSNTIIRNLSKTGLPATIVSSCLATGKSIRLYALGEIDETELLREFGSVINSSLSTATFSMLGQIAIPIPVLGGLIGGIVGYTLTNSFYQNFLDSLNEVSRSEERYQSIAIRCQATRIIMLEYQHYLDSLFQEKLNNLHQETITLFKSLTDPNIHIDTFTMNINQFAEFLGKELLFKDIGEFNTFMQSDKPLII
ncbi:hypothetical protein [Pasteurella multocida]|uniref:hypothetical protein n=1 Tax=Pasteurella multocida TaxID=747 RepID=UPI001F538017|nr:hypothetical protein [Pasteurella multocida]HDR1806018.1 hypothetical protein [Pasteurella multocida]HDR1868836.1 hypothetical protein [Pasteurella multocida]